MRVSSKADQWRGWDNGGEWQMHEPANQAGLLPFRNLRRSTCVLCGMEFGRHSRVPTVQVVHLVQASEEEARSFGCFEAAPLRP